MPPYPPQLAEDAMPPVVAVVTSMNSCLLYYCQIFPIENTFLYFQAVETPVDCELHGPSGQAPSRNTCRARQRLLASAAANEP